MNTYALPSTMPASPEAEPIAGACPDCGSALLLMHEHTEDVYIGELRLDNDLDQILPTLATWAKGLENRDYLVGCARCDARLDHDQLVPATPSEVDLADAELAHLTATVCNDWQCDPDTGAIASCRDCGSHELLIAAERDVALAATYSLEGGDADWCERWLRAPWDVQCTVRACNSCLRRLAPDELTLQLRLDL